MKTILRMIIILVAAALVAGVLTLIVNNTSLAATGPESGRPPVMTDANGQAMQPPARPEGEREGEGGASLGSGLIQILVTLAKLTGITVIVLLVQKAISWLTARRSPRLAHG